MFLISLPRPAFSLFTFPLWALVQIKVRKERGLPSTSVAGNTESNTWFKADPVMTSVGNHPRNGCYFHTSDGAQSSMHAVGRRILMEFGVWLASAKFFSESLLSVREKAKPSEFRQEVLKGVRNRVSQV